MSLKEFCLIMFLGAIPITLVCVLYAIGFMFLFHSSLHIVLSSTIAGVAGIFMMFGSLKYCDWLSGKIREWIK